MDNSINGINDPASVSNSQLEKGSWQEYFTAHKSDLNHTGIFIPLLSAMETTLHALGEGMSDPQVFNQEQFKKSYTRILDDNGKIGLDFDEVKAGASDAQKQAAASKAIDAYNDIYETFQEAGVSLSSETKDTIRNAYGFGAKASSGVFQGTEDKVSLSKAWDKTPSGAPRSKDDGSAITNPLGSVTGTVNGSSATA